MVWTEVSVRHSDSQGTQGTIAFIAFISFYPQLTYIYVHRYTSIKCINAYRYIFVCI